MTTITTSDQAVTLAEGVTLQVRRWHQPGGSDHTLVLLHEALGNIELWRDFPMQLARATGLDVLAYDRRGYGSSTPEAYPRPMDYLEVEGEVWLPRLLEALALDQVILVGHSDGGSIVLVGAGAMPDRVTGLVTMAPHITVDRLTIQGIRETAERYRTTDLPERLARRHGERGRLLFDAWQDTWLDPEFQQRMNFEPWLARIRCPTLVLQGENDEYGLPEQVHSIVERLGARARGLMVPEAGHFPHAQQPEFVVSAIRSFVTSIIIEPGEGEGGSASARSNGDSNQ
ncbi:MAG: alpha/beta hydrolase [Marinobacter sp.]|uniref:alpha/beta fold hydrolase n=1 Tax=Marinobacter sp. TaxID=50741 RepID=UPI00299F4B3E|nr:alpha/beta hydrolase [Marinobacter sp.]MDX1635355.1 alpha/beta hydrolase [Marinobacter sp.]